MSKIQIEVELEQDGQSLKGAERFKGETTLPDGRKVYVKVYGAAPAAKVAEPKAPTVRKAAAAPKAEAPAAAPAANPLAGLSEAQMALLAKVMAQLKQG